MSYSHTSIAAQGSPTALLKLARTQVYLTALHHATLARLAKEQACAKSELIRQALDIFIATKENQAISRQAAVAANRRQALELMSGLWANRPEMNDASAYVRSLRDERRF